MKKGSTDDPFAEEPDDEPSDPDGNRNEPDNTSVDTEISGLTDSGDEDTQNETKPAVQTQSLPFIHARDGVKDQRRQRPIFLRDHVEDGIDDLVDEMEDTFDQRVYKTDVTEAAMIVALENPELLQETLEQWGYGWS